MNSPNMKLEVKRILSKIAFIGKSFDNRLKDMYVFAGRYRTCQKLE